MCCTIQGFTLPVCVLHRDSNVELLFVLLYTADSSSVGQTKWCVAVDWNSLFSVLDRMCELRVGWTHTHTHTG